MALRRLALLLACTVLLFTGEPAGRVMAEGTITWTLTDGPTGGSVNVLLSTPKAAGLVFAGTNGGVYLTRDHGIHWNAVCDGLPDDRAISALASTPDASVVFAGTHSGVFLTRDAGITWRPALLDQSVLSLSIDPQNPTVVYAATMTTLLRSENGGDTWTDLGPALRNAAGAPTTLAAPTTSPTTSATSLALAPDSAVLYAATDSGIYASRDRGAHWVRSSDGLPEGTRIQSVTATTRGLFAATVRGLYRSRDGKSFTAIEGAVANTVVHPVVADLQAPDRMLANTARGLARSVDGGTTWAIVTNAPKGAPIYSLAFGDRGEVFVGSARGVWRTGDDGATGQSVDSGLVSSSIFSLLINPDDPATLLAATRYGLSLSQDRGATWREAVGIADTFVLALAADPSTLGTVYAGTWGGSVLISQDGGSSFYLLKENIANNAPIGSLAIAHRTPDTTTWYAGTLGSGVFRSENAGKAWTSQSSGLGENARVTALAFVPPSTLYAGTDRGLFKLDISLANPAWTVSSSDLPVDSVAAIVADTRQPPLVFVAYSSNGLYQGGDQNQWRALGRGEFPTRVRFQAFARHPVHRDVMYAGTDRGIYRSDDGGVSWVAANKGLPPGTEVLAIAVDPQSPEQLFIGTSSHGVIAGTDLMPRDFAGWVLPAAGALGAVVVMGALTIGWHTKVSPRARERAWARTWPEMEGMVTNALWTFGQANPANVNKIPPRQLAHALQYYARLHPEDALTLQDNPLALKLDNYVLAQKFISRWKAAWEIGENASALAPVTSQMIDQLCNLFGFNRIDERTYKGLTGYVVRAPSLRLKIPPRFPIIFMPEHNVGEEHIGALRDLMNVLNMTSYFALIVDLRDWPDQDERQSLKRLVRQAIHDFIVLDGHDIRRLLAARDHARRLVDIILDQVDLSVISPYVTSGPVPENMFFGREQELKTIVRRARDTNFAIVGGRKIGKTSVLGRVHRLLQDAPEYKPFYLDCQAVHNHRDFSEAIDALWRTPLPKPTPEGFRRMALELLAQYPNQTIVMLFDEIDGLLRWDVSQGEQLFRILRALAQENRIRFIFCGEKALNAALRNPKLAFFNFCSILPLSYLTLEEARRVVQEPMQELGITLQGDAELADYMIEQTTGHPNIVQYVCQNLIERINIRHDRTITSADVDVLIQSTQFAEYFATISWGNATPLERLITLLMLDQPEVTVSEMAELLRAQGVSPTPTLLERALDGLCLYSILRRDGPKYAFAAPAIPEIFRRSQDVDGLLDSLIGQIRAGKGAVR